MTESEFQVAVIDLAHLLGFRVAHFRPAQTKHGWRTPVGADGAGFPDLVLLKGERVLAVELKGERGTLTDDQGAWLVAFEKAGVETHVWKPADWDNVVEALSGKPT